MQHNSLYNVRMVSISTDWHTTFTFQNTNVFGIYTVLYYYSCRKNH